MCPLRSLVTSVLGYSVCAQCGMRKIVSTVEIAIPDFFSNPGISGLKNANPGIPGLNPGIESLILN